jgi:phosphoserine/homoserine phosphotransferase
MNIVCLDLEGVLVPEIWIAFAEETGIKELRRTTRDEPDYNKLMRYRMDILDANNFKLSDVQSTIAKVKPLEGAYEFLSELRRLSQVVILSDTFNQFASPLMKQLDYPTILCNELVIDENDRIVDIKMRQEDGKRKAIDAFKSLNYKTFAAGDSYNDLSMIRRADNGCLFRAPAKILETESDLKLCTTYDEFLETIKASFNE